MSSDTYLLMRLINGKYYVDVESMSDDRIIPPPGLYSRRFDTIESAIRYASREESEYGVVFGEGLADYGGDMPDGDVL